MGGAGAGATATAAGVYFVRSRLRPVARGSPWSFGQMCAVAGGAMVAGQLGTVYPTMLTTR